MFDLELHLKVLDDTCREYTLETRGISAHICMYYVPQTGRRCAIGRLLNLFEKISFFCLVCLLLILYQKKVDLYKKSPRHYLGVSTSPRGFERTNGSRYIMPQKKIKYLAGVLDLNPGAAYANPYVLRRSDLPTTHLVFPV